MILRSYMRIAVNTFLITTLLVSSAFAETRRFEKAITVHSNVSIDQARLIALDALRQDAIAQMGSYVEARQSTDGNDLTQSIRSIAAGLTKIQIVDENIAVKGSLLNVQIKADVSVDNTEMQAAIEKLHSQSILRERLQVLESQNYQLRSQILSLSTQPASSERIAELQRTLSQNENDAEETFLAMFDKMRLDLLTNEANLNEIAALVSKEIRSGFSPDLVKISNLEIKKTSSEDLTMFGKVSWDHLDYFTRNSLKIPDPDFAALVRCAQYNGVLRMLEDSSIIASYWFSGKVKQAGEIGGYKTKECPLNAEDYFTLVSNEILFPDTPFEKLPEAIRNVFNVPLKLSIVYRGRNVKSIDLISPEGIIFKGVMHFSIKIDPHHESSVPTFVLR